MVVTCSPNPVHSRKETGLPKEQMRKSRFSEEQIICILQEVPGGRLVKDVCREHGVSEGTYHRWKAKYGGLDVRHSSSRRVLPRLTPSPEISSEQCHFP